ncbi:asparagine synthetase B [Candidatus Poribacteria bacterium]|nr:asparagine synthetase B [Candidatus Poribacteria bacterium]
MKKYILIFVLSLILVTTNIVKAQNLLIPMDNKQNDHLRAYGLVYWSLQSPRQYKAEWLLNYRSGSFLIEDHNDVRQKANIMGVSFETLSASDLNTIYQIIDNSNMESVSLEKAPKIAIYTPPDREPWDDAVTLALTYADIPYDTLWDKEVLAGKLTLYDWLHCHHEDFTGQYGKFYGAYRNALWYQKQVMRFKKSAQESGYSTVKEHKLAVAKSIKDYALQGGFFFMMCTPDTLDIALSAEGIDIISPEIDGTPIDPDCQSKLDFSRTLAFENFILETRPDVYEFSNIDNPKPNLNPMDGLEDFVLFEFAAKHDPIPTMLTQNHVNTVRGFLGQTTSFNKDTIKNTITIMGDIEGSNYAKYLHGTIGRGTFTFLGGHDPEDYKHRVGDPQTNLALHKNSPGYRLILNNVLFPAAKKKNRKT